MRNNCCFSETTVYGILGEEKGKMNYGTVDRGCSNFVNNHREFLLAIPVKRNNLAKIMSSKVHEWVKKPISKRR
jgi:hypothetical protein